MGELCRNRSRPKRITVRSEGVGTANGIRPHEALPDHIVTLKRGHEVEAIIIDAFLRSHLASTRLSDVTPSQFASCRDERLKTVKPVTINRELGIVQHAFEVAWREWSIPLVTNPVRAISKPQRGNPRDRRLRNGEWERLMEACQKCRNRLVERYRRLLSRQE